MIEEGALVPAESYKEFNSALEAVIGKGDELNVYLTESSSIVSDQ